MKPASDASIPKEVMNILDPARSVLVVWDVQKMLVNNIFNKEEFLASAKIVIDAARSAGVRIFFTRITQLPDHFQSPVRKYLMSRRSPLAFTPDGMELAMDPDPSDIIINKNTADIFIGTNFELMIRNAGVSTIVFVGIATEMGIESSARAASNRSFFPVIATDAVSSSNRDAHFRSLENLKSMMIMYTARELASIWSKLKTD